MDNEELITKWLEESHRRGRRETAAMVDGLVAHLRNRRWRRRANRAADMLSLAVVAVVAMLSVAWMPLPEYDSYISSSPGITAEADCRMLHEILSRQ